MPSRHLIRRSRITLRATAYGGQYVEAHLTVRDSLLDLAHQATVRRAKQVIVVLAALAAAREGADAGAGLLGFLRDLFS